MAKNTTGVFDPADKQIAVIYGDGSSDLRYNVYGCGITGYIYNKASIGETSSDIPSKYYITEKGYIEFEQFPKSGLKKVIPCFYFDGLYGYKGNGGSDVAELLAFINAFNNLLVPEYGFNFEKMIFKTDSSYVILALDHLQTQGEQALGNPLKANQDLLKEILIILKTLKDKNIELETIKVQGHSTSLGNNTADRLANTARVSGLQKFFIRENKKHWSKTEDPHPMIGFKQLFFVNSDKLNNENIYSIMNYKTNVEVGKRTHEALFGLTLLSNPVGLIEEVKSNYNQNVSPLNLLSFIDLSVLFNRDTSYYHSLINNDCFTFNIKNNSLVNIFGDIVAKNVYPPGLAAQAFDKMNVLYNIINKFKIWKEKDEKDKNMVFINVSEHFYSVSKKGKYNCLIPNGTNILDINVEAFGGKHKIPLSLSIDTLSRNAFKKLEAESPSVYLVLIKTEKVIEYCTLIETSNKDIGIYCNPYSCKIFLQ